jgi:5-methylcytosine-specific restriction endonuclease McrA
MEEISDNNNVIKKYSREWREENPEKAKRMEEKWQKDITNHPEYIEKYYKIVREGNRLYGKTPNRQKAKYRDDLKYNINCRISSLIWYSLKKNKNRDSWIDIVKYNIDDLVERLKSTMPEGYNWSDFLQGKLHIDHIIPRSAFNFTEKEDIDFKRCWALENLQLLPSEENLKKNDKLSKPFQPCLKLKVLDSIKG